MLVLSRKVGERILVGDKVVVTVVRIGPNAVRLGIEAPRDMNIVRDELGPVRSCEVCGGDGWVPDMSGNLPNGETAGPFIEKMECPVCNGTKTHTKIQADESDLEDLGRRAIDPLGVASCYEDELGLK